MTTTPLLLSEDLIAPYRRHQQILAPDEIPIHPDVYNAPFTFTDEFMTEVKERVPNMLRQDISEIERILGIQLGLEIEKDGIRQDREKTSYGAIHYVVYPPPRKELHVSIMASSVGILPHRPAVLEITTRDLSSFPDLRHPMPLEKARQYSSTTDGLYLQLPSWYTHNVHDQGETFFHYMRAFAIAFNNHGLLRLGRS